MFSDVLLNDRIYFDDLPSPWDDFTIAPFQISTTGIGSNKTINNSMYESCDFSKTFWSG
jgi:hypothetical protein